MPAETIESLTRNATAAELESFLLARDRKLWLEMEASHFLSPISDTLVDIFPTAKFLILFRDPLSWLESELNQRIRTKRRPDTEHWFQWAEFKYGRSPAVPPREESSLAAYGLPSIQGVLKNYSETMSHLLLTVPRARRLVIRTNEIGPSRTAIARFLGIDAGLLSAARSHGGKAPAKPLVLNEHLPKDYLHPLVHQICNPVYEDLLTEAV